MDQDLFNEIYAKITDVKLTDKQRKDAYLEESAKLTDEEKLNFFHKLNVEKKLANGFVDEYICKEEQKNHLCLFEFSSIDRAFDIQVNFLLMNAYIHDRLNTMQFNSEDEKKGAESFVARLFNYKQSNYMDAINEVVKSENNPAYIAEIPNEIKLKSGEIIPMPSFAQYRNAYNYCNVHLDEGRILARNIFGTLPTTELTFKIHGVFKDIDEANIYRIKNASKVEQLYQVPLGKTVLADNFKANKLGVILYNPSDPDLEIMLQGKHNILKAEAKVIKDRSSKLYKDDRIPKESLDKIRKYRREQDKVARKINKVKNDDNKKYELEAESTKLEQKYNKEVAKYTEESESIITGFKVKKGKITGKEDYLINT